MAVKDELLTVDEASAWLRVHPKTLRRWAAANRIPHLSFCGVMRFSRDELEEFLQERARHAQDPKVRRA